MNEGGLGNGTGVLVLELAAAANGIAERGEDVASGARDIVAVEILEFTSVALVAAGLVLRC